MRLATYTQRTVATRASTIAVILLVVTILQGSSANLTLVQHLAPQLQPVITLIWFTLYCTALAGLMLTHGMNWIFWITRYRLLLTILLLGTMASVTWSIDPHVSLQRTVHLLGSSVIAIYLGFMIPLTSILTVLAWVLTAILLTSTAFVFIFPLMGIEEYEGLRVWRGILTSKNTLGFWAATAVLLYFSQMARPITFFARTVYFVLAAMALFILYMSNSATSVLALIVGGLAALYFFIAIRFNLGFVRMGLMAVLFTVVIVLVMANMETAELIGRSDDLTGRGEVWSQTWKLILDRPLKGYGYGSIWNPNESTIWIQQSLTDFTWVVYHAHNGFLQIASEIGLPLSMLALLMVIQQVIEIFYCQYDRQQVGVLFVLGFVVAYLVSNYSEARFLVNRELYWILFLALPISMLRQVNLVLDANIDTDDEDPDLDQTSKLNSPSAPNMGPVAGPAIGLHTELRNNPASEPVAITAQKAVADEQDDLDVLFDQDHMLVAGQEQDRFEKLDLIDVEANIPEDGQDRFDKVVEHDSPPSTDSAAAHLAVAESRDVDIDIELEDSEHNNGH